MNSEAPNLLVLGDYPIGHGNGIGETLGNLLATFPDDRLFQIHPVDLQPLSGHARGRSIPFAVPRPPAGMPPWSRPFYQPILKVRQALAERALYRLASDAIRAHRISAVLTYPVTPWVLFAAERLSRSFPDVRFVFYVMDDWEGHHTCFNLPFTARRRRALAGIVAASRVRFACSDRMRRDYETRFGNAWQVLHKGVSHPSGPPSAPLRQPWRILYAGGMNIFRADAVLAFAEGLRRFREKSARDVTLTLLGAAADATSVPALAPYDFVRFEAWVDNDACQRRLAEADLLYLPLSMLSKLERIANLAMPTKFSEYLASGRPVIFHVPRDSEVQDLASRAGLPLTINSVAPEDVCAMLLRLDREGIDLAHYHERAGRLLRDEFDEHVLRARLLHALFPIEFDRPQTRLEN